MYVFYNNRIYNQRCFSLQEKHYSIDFYRKENSFLKINRIYFFK